MHRESKSKSIETGPLSCKHRNKVGRKSVNQVTDPRKQLPIARNPINSTSMERVHLRELERMREDKRSERDNNDAKGYF